MSRTRSAGAAVCLLTLGTVGGCDPNPGGPSAPAMAPSERTGPPAGAERAGTPPPRQVGPPADR
jgi:hypothetical protein